MLTTCLSGPHISANTDAESVVDAATRAGTVTWLTRFAGNDSRVRVTPPLAFEVEEFDSQIPEENWRHRQGMPQTLDFPLPRGC